jgi:hypothetical protein
LQSAELFFLVDETGEVNRALHLLDTHSKRLGELGGRTILEIPL